MSFFSKLFHEYSGWFKCRDIMRRNNKRSVLAFVISFAISVFVIVGYVLFD